MAQRRDRSALVYVQRFNVRAGLPHLEVRSIVFFVGLLALVGSAGWLYLHQASEVAAYVQEIRALQDQNDLLQQEILALQSDVAVLGSLQHVEALGAARGYQAPESADPSSYLVLPYEAGSASETSRAGEAAAQGPAIAEPVQGRRGLAQQLIDQLLTWMGSPAR